MGSDAGASPAAAHAVRASESAADVRRASTAGDRQADSVGDADGAAEALPARDEPARGDDPHAGSSARGERRSHRAEHRAATGVRHPARVGQAALIAAIAISCGGSKPEATAPKPEVEVDARTAEKDAKGLLDEIYESIGHADTDGLMTLAAEPLVVYGPRMADAHANRTDALVALKAIVDPRKKRAVKSSRLSVVASPGGRSAWAVDIVDIGGEPLALTAVLSNADDVWQVSAVELAATPAMKSVRAQLKQDAVVPPGMVGIAKIDPTAKLAVDKFTKGMADSSVWGDDLQTRSDAVAIGPGNGDLTKGKADLKKLFKKRLKANVRELAAGEITAATTADGQLAWVTQPVVRFEDDREPLPLRVFAVFEKHDAEWKLIALQESLAIDAPGTGVAFKKIVLPAATAVAQAPAADPPPKKPKHKHKQPPPKTDGDDDDQ